MHAIIKNPWCTQFSGPCGTELTHQAALLREMREQHGVRHLKNGWCEFFTLQLLSLPWQRRNAMPRSQFCLFSSA